MDRPLLSSSPATANTLRRLLRASTGIITAEARLLFARTLFTEKASEAELVACIREQSREIERRIDDALRQRVEGTGHVDPADPADILSLDPALTYAIREAIMNLYPAAMNAFQVRIRTSTTGEHLQN